MGVAIEPHRRQTPRAWRVNRNFHLAPLVLRHEAKHSAGLVCADDAGVTGQGAADFDLITEVALDQINRRFAESRVWLCK